MLRQLVLGFSLLSPAALAANCPAWPAAQAQAELARRMGTTQSAIARMESGRFKPSHSTLEKYAQATGTRLRVTFEVIGADAA